MGWHQEDPPSKDDLHDVAALADGSLPREREAAVRARIAASPALTEAYGKQRRAIAAIRSATAPAPRRLESHRQDLPAPAQSRSHVAWALVVLAVLVVAVVVVLILR